jgi:predicted membrane chloride channel (bestrophin family)
MNIFILIQFSKKMKYVRYVRFRKIWSSLLLKSYSTNKNVSTFQPHIVTQDIFQKLLYYYYL